MRVVSESDAMQSLPSLLKEVKIHSVEIRDGEEMLGAIVSKEDYEIVRKAKVARLLAAMDRLGEAMREEAAQKGISLDDLERMLDRKAP
jgi:PHD/YefM family antitoxin component YafN of YafNO toxin-antitoxin module